MFLSYSVGKCNFVMLLYNYYDLEQGPGLATIPLLNTYAQVNLYQMLKIIFMVYLTNTTIYMYGEGVGQYHCRCISGSLYVYGQDSRSIPLCVQGQDGGSIPLCVYIYMWKGESIPLCVRVWEGGWVDTTDHVWVGKWVITTVRVVCRSSPLYMCEWDDGSIPLLSVLVGSWVQFVATLFFFTRRH